MERKITWTQLLIFGILNSLFLACAGEIEKPGKLQRYVYVNNSDYFILIKRYVNNVKTEFSLQKKDSLVQEVRLGAGSTDLIIRSDSVKVIFDNSKFLLSSVKLGGDIGLLSSANYENYEYKDVYIGKYIFSNADYDRAKDCNGSCD